VASACTRLRLLEASGQPPQPEDELVRVGYVAAAYDGTPLGGAVVRVRGIPGVGERRYLSDASGRVVLDPLPRGRHLVDVQRGGYVHTEGEIPVPWDGDFLFLLEEVRDEGDDGSLGRIFGQVVDEGTGVGIPDVDVSVVAGRTVRAISNRTGRFLIDDLSPGPVEVRLERLGYEPRTATLQVRGGRTVEVYASMTVEPIELEPVEVAVASRYLERSGFYQRVRNVSGDHFTYRDIERMSAQLVADVVRRAGGVTVASNQVGWGSEALSNRLAASADGRCRLRPYFNGVPTVDFNLELVPPDEIEALEIYQGPNVPIEYFDEMQRAGASCGVVLIWTRDPSRVR
jgi:hypothetical protein